MAYTSSGRMPIERASKLGHVKFIDESRIQRLLESFERVDTDNDDHAGELSGHLDLSDAGELENIVAIDGSHAAVPNAVHNHRRLAFVSASVVILKRSVIAEMKRNPILDPRDVAGELRNSSSSKLAVLPLSGVTIPGETVVQTIRRTVDDVLRYTNLYDTLKFLISREWLLEYEMQEHMDCLECGVAFVLPRSKLSFRCPRCQAVHTLADYLTMVQGPPDDWATEEVAIALRTVLETLLLMDFLRVYRDRPRVLRRTLFVKDGPLLLRAQLSRLVQPIREFLAYLNSIGRELHVVGVEKTGALVDHIPQIGSVLQSPGDYFLPTIKYLHERIQGVPFVENDYRNRVQYGSKVVVRLGPNHIVVLNVPTGDFRMEPQVQDLYGFNQSASALSEMLSYSFENALIPLVLVNSATSISMAPSNEILEVFARRLLGG